ncbi:MAG TPA: exodeoxyribonuclease VII large subunit [Burkholderiaceae bacterium]|nr:exodeoxyribonuclease VII large subunit [Burkholderiaceae bacterium]
MIPSNISEDIYPMPSILSVSRLNQAVARMLERNFPLTWISGEISNFTRAASGHWYFTLKDDAAQVRAVMFRGRAQYADFAPRDGDKVEVRALVTLYAPRGEYQLNVEAMRRSGMGNLYEAFLRLKEKLALEGLFAASRKRSIPVFTGVIGIVTSPQATALRDILATLRRRAPHVQVILYPTPVQGDGAAQTIAQAITTASARAECDVLLVCRGGGSIEDLWSFNEETVARAIATCTMPVVSGVGHETDFTIADFAADLRAPTPTAAAELAATPRADWIAALQTQASNLNRNMARQLGSKAQMLDWLSRQLISPSAHIMHDRLQLQSLHNRLLHARQASFAEVRFALMHLRTRWAAQLPDAAPHRIRLEQDSRRFAICIRARMTAQRQALSALASQLELLDPQRTLERGYAIVTDAKGMIIRGPRQLHPRDTVTMRLAEGLVDIGIASVQESLE